MAPNFGATNSSNFSALPGGLRDRNGLYGYLGTGANFAINASYESYYGLIYLMHENVSVGLAFDDTKTGFSVRLLKD